MALRIIRLLRSGTYSLRYSAYATSLHSSEIKQKEYKTETNIVYPADPDKFGTLSPKLHVDKVVLEDEQDIKEENLTKSLPLPSQKLTIHQYAVIIKQHLKQKRLREAINVLETRMLQEDRVKPDNYIYNILIGACADVGYTKKAFQLFNEMKRRALKPTGDTYTCLFEACTNSPWLSDGLSKATHLRSLMLEKGIEPNLTNYNAMIKAFGRCGDLPTAFKLVDEMVSKKIKIRVHTFNHLLQACITDKEHGLKHALIVWRKMLQMKEKPNIYSFNLMLKSVKECNLGSKSDIVELISAIKDHIAISSGQANLQIEENNMLLQESNNLIDILKESKNLTNIDTNNNQFGRDISLQNNESAFSFLNEESTSKLTVVNDNTAIQLCKKTVEKRTVPNLLSKVIQLQDVLTLQSVDTVQQRFAVIGGQDDFLKEMAECSIKPDIKTFTQMLPLIDDTEEAENKLLDSMKTLNIRGDISFYNMLIKKRCMSSNYDAGLAVLKIIKKEGKLRKKLYPDRKKLHLKPNIMTYGVLALSCKTKENAEKLLEDMKEAQIKVNIEILGTLLRQGTSTFNVGYIMHIMEIVKEERLDPNLIFLKHLEAFHEKYLNIIKEKDGKQISPIFKKSFLIFSTTYKRWLKDFDIEKVINPEHVWAQFKNTYPETVQRQNNEIKEPKKFYKKIRKNITK